MIRAVRFTQGIMLVSSADNSKKLTKQRNCMARQQASNCTFLSFSFWWTNFFFFYHGCLSQLTRASTNLMDSKVNDLVNFQ